MRTRPARVGPQLRFVPDASGRELGPKHAVGQRLLDEFRRKALEDVELAVREGEPHRLPFDDHRDFDASALQELRKMARLGKMPMRTDGWNADYPDAENFMQLLYGPNVGQENHARFSLPEFDKLYDAAYRLPNSPERTRLFDKMTELIIAYAPWRLMEHRMEDHLLQPWILNYKSHPVRTALWRYLDVDPAKRPK